MRTLLLALIVLVTDASIAPAAVASRAMLDALAGQGVDPARVTGSDASGVPLVCGTTAGLFALHGPPTRPPLDGARLLPAGTRGWEAIPGVIRNDGIEAFRLEVDTNGAVSSVVLTSIFSLGIVPPSPPPLTLRDDGGGVDLVAGDDVFTAGPFHWDPSVPMSSTFRSDPDSPAGLQAAEIGTLIIEEIGGATSEFLVRPSVGVLASDIPAVEPVVLAPDVAVSPHLVNVATDARATQRFLRQSGFGEIVDLTSRIYELLPDVFDFFVLFSTDKIERLPPFTAENFNAGIHLSTKVDYTGTGVPTFDASADYGSAGRLQSLNALDAYDRGLYAANVTHEILHQWSAFVDASLGIKQDSAHWSGFTSAESLLGGFRWVPAGGGSFVLDCEQGRNGAFHVAPIDKYLMGLLDTAAVPTLLAYDSSTASPGLRCGAMPAIPILPSEIVTSVTIDDIQALHGVRTPGPAGAQRDFHIGFVAESHERLLNATEMTFYEILAEHYASSVPTDAPDPYVGFNWVPVERFFGEGITWSTDVALSTTTTTTLPGDRAYADPVALVAGVQSTPTSASPMRAVTASDALAVLSAAVGTFACELCVCDVDGSGGITATDALATLLAAVGLPVELRCPECE